MKTRQNRLTRVICILTIVALALVGCGSDGDQTSSVDVAQLGEELLALDPEIPEMEKVNGSAENADVTFAVLADFDYEKIDNYFYAYSSSGSPEEVAVIALKNKSDAGDLMKALKAHIESRKNTFQQYTPEQVGMLDNAILTYQGNVVLYAVDSKNGIMQDTFKEKVQ